MKKKKKKNKKKLPSISVSQFCFFFFFFWSREKQPNEMSSTSTSVVPEDREWGCWCPQTSCGSSLIVLKHLKDAYTDGSCSPGCQRLRVGPALLKRRPATSSQQPTLSHTQPTSPNLWWPSWPWSTWTSSYTRQRDGTLDGLILGEAQPWVVRLVSASCCLKSGGQLCPNFRIHRVTSWFGRSEAKISGCTE